MPRRKAYFALKLAGDSPVASHMVVARETVHRLGGLEHTNSYVRFYLALVGAVGWELVPAIPPELMLLPNWFYINIYEMSSWTRGIVIPMAILSAVRPEFRLPERARVDELFKDSSPKDSGVRLEQADSVLEECFPGGGPRAEAVRKASLEAAAAKGASRSEAVDAGAHGADRGTGGDLSLDDEFDFCVDRAGAWAGRSGDVARDQRVFEV